MATLIDDYQSGLSVSAVARRYEVNVKTATKHLVDHGIPIRSHETKLPRSEHAALLELKAAGWNNVEIARHYGCTKQAVHLALRRAEEPRS